MQNKNESMPLECTSVLSLVDRKRLSLSGVDEVLSYDENSIELIICGVKVVVEGEGLKVTHLSVGDGEVLVGGEVNSIIYEDKKSEKRGFLSSILGK